MEVETFFNVEPRFENRSHAGHRLAIALGQYKSRPDTLVVGISHGGLVTAAEVADELNLPFEVVVIARLKTPGHDMTMGALGPEGVRVVDEELVRALRIPRAAVELETYRQTCEIFRQEKRYRADRLPLDVSGKTILLVDDGVSSGATMDVAVAVLRRHHAARIVAAVPVAPRTQAEALRRDVDELVVLEVPEPFVGLHFWYRDFRAMTDDDVLPLLRHRVSPRLPPRAGFGATVR